MLRSLTSCMRINSDAPTGRRWWRILLMTGGATSSARDRAASFFRRRFSIRVSSNLFGLYCSRSSESESLFISMPTWFVMMLFVPSVVALQSKNTRSSLLLRSCSFFTKRNDFTHGTIRDTVFVIYTQLYSRIQFLAGKYLYRALYFTGVVDLQRLFILCYPL